MKAKVETKNKKSFDVVKTFRKIKKKISKDIADMNLEQMQEYFKSRKIRPE
jgi:hypothetical protein